MTSSSHVLKQLFHAAEVHPQKLALVLDDQSWTYSELIEMVEHIAYHLHRRNIVHGQIIYQFVERGFEMVAGILAIMSAGGVYCPINSAEPPNHLADLLQRIQGRYVLLHRKTHKQFPTAVVSHIILMDDILLRSSYMPDTKDLPLCRTNGAAFIIGISGTTGQLKIVVHTHRSFSAAIHLYAQWDGGLYTIRDQVLQVTTCSWVSHLWEISVALTVGSTLILLRPGSHMNIGYLAQTLFRQQVTTLTVNSALIRAFTHYIEQSQRLETFQFMRQLYFRGNNKYSIDLPRYVFVQRCSI